MYVCMYVCYVFMHVGMYVVCLLVWLIVLLYDFSFTSSSVRPFICPSVHCYFVGWLVCKCVFVLCVACLFDGCLVGRSLGF